MRSSSFPILASVLATMISLGNPDGFAAETKIEQRGPWLEQMLSSTVLVVLKSSDNVEVSAGTGVYLLSHSNNLFIVTAKHVLFGKDATSTNLLAPSATIRSLGTVRNNNIETELRLDLASMYPKK